MTFVGYTHVSLEMWGGIFCLIAALSAYIVDGKESGRGRKMVLIQLAVSVLLFSDTCAWLYRGSKGILGYYMVRISNFMVFETGYLISMIFTAYMADYLEESGEIDRSICRVIYIIGTVGMILMMVSQFNHMYYYFDADNYYHRAPMYWLCLTLGLLETALYAAVLIRYRSRLNKREQLLFCSYVVLPSLALAIQYVFYGISLSNIAIMLSALFMFIGFLTERSVHLAEQERKMGEMQVQLVLSQIQPHFIYNTLNSIYYLCEKDPKTAQKAVNWFAELLRSNMDSMRRNTPVTFETELRSLDNYLKLEKMRFDDEIQTEFEIQTMDFMLPPMTLQPIVENAVKHGLGKKAGGGTVKIASFNRESYFEIVISDDGVGYTPENNANDGRSHTGIENVKKRLWFMCRGTLDISGKKDEGTTVVIHIPKERNINDHSCGR